MATYFTLIKYMDVWPLMSRCINICMYGYLLHAAEIHVCMATYFTRLKYMYVWHYFTLLKYCFVWLLISRC